MKSGPLRGLKVVELAGLAPAPFAATMLADLGADVVRVDRAKPGQDVLGIAGDPLMRGRRTIGVDTKQPEGVEVVLRLAERSDVFIEGFRPGVAERMGLGPEQVHARNPRVVYGRLTGWGQDGPLASAAGHDINYAGIAGALEPIGRAGEPPVPPLNLVADFAGGGMLLAMGVLAALYERAASGRGQVVDAAMVDGAALLTTQLHGMRAAGLWPGERGTNLLDGGAPFYDTYETADGKYVALGAIEMRFWADLVKVLGLEGEDLPVHVDATEWPRLRKILADAVRKHTRDELVAKAEGTDACLTPVLSPWEAAEHPHNAARGTFVDIGGVVQPAPAPRFDRTPPRVPEAPHEKGADTAEVLAELGYDEPTLASLRESAVIA
ncbi:alpha-methylacyl-CoA racemase [Amycolatopsis bartoniae]|uniref:CoA transferase n=1 Tax=Amycolatopsis bartoniae TaxID=941986 RepID=A0A8H9IZP7_9PSEU|nr:CaiB/BaiF CoA-transferase family protein [Amycolatopsis bartoniae]MBB2937622.1 alpha-methylacyl-CoA racemase [Amycolatopsis bartoniae]TVT00636.1 CoA transferase [Amycolatopsis bartoniae]GHF82626.1 CoA transferase [Amycolatopsis bartoniae]